MGVAEPQVSTAAPPAGVAAAAVEVEVGGEVWVAPAEAPVGGAAGVAAPADGPRAGEEEVEAVREEERPSRGELRAVAMAEGDVELCASWRGW